MSLCNRLLKTLLFAALLSLAVNCAARRSAATQKAEFALKEAIAFVSTRDDPNAVPALPAMEIYVMNPDGSDPRRLTANTNADFGPALSPDGRFIVFDSHRLHVAPEPLNTSHLFVMDRDGQNLAHLGRGSSATWSPDGRRIAFHMSASGTGLAIREDPGAAADDSDLFVVNVDNAVTRSLSTTNLTNSPLTIEEDADWSPDGERIVFTRHDVSDPSHQYPLSTEIWVINADGSNLIRLTHNAEEERAPAWSRDGRRILYVCRRGPVPRNSTFPTSELCVMNDDGSGELRLTTNSVSELTPHWSVDGQRIVFHKAVRDSKETRAQNELFQINADGTREIRLTHTVGQNRFGNPGLIMVGRGK